LGIIGPEKFAKQLAFGLSGTPMPLSRNLQPHLVAGFAEYHLAALRLLRVL